MAVPVLAFERQQARAEQSAEHAADRRQARIIIKIVEQDPLDAVGVANHKNRPAEITALDEQLLEQFRIAGGETVGGRDRREAPQTQPPRGARRHG